MNDKRIIWLVIVILVFVGIAFYTSHKADNLEFNQDRKEAIEDAISRPLITINAKHQYKDGQHTFLGSFEVPTPCHSNNSEVKKTESSDITEIALTYFLPAGSENCVQTIADRQFKVTFAGDVDEDVIATLNGEAVNFNVFEVGSDEDISKVEIFIKG